uniref:CRAL-TRIO domain-containing protein n=1 Tax=Kalanchoe fedtschenkoi TaxID=63787 RepID=A0A7N0UTD7_KALFE
MNTFTSQSAPNRRVFKIQGTDKQGRPLLQIIAAAFLARSVSADALKKYLEAEIYPRLETKQFSVLYVNTGVERGENFPGISALRSILDAVPAGIKANIAAVYFLHPGLNSRLFLAAFGRLILGSEVYGKIKYLSRLDRAWEHVRRKGIELPEFVVEHDEDLDSISMVDYGLESDHRRVHAGPSMDSSLSMYSMRCIS